MNDIRKKTTPVLESASLLRELHLLTVESKDQTAEAEAIRDQMETPWYAMTSQEQERIGGLSEDLYALAEGGPPRVAMTAQELAAWKAELQERKTKYLTGDIDGWLAFWRKPRPKDFPPPDGIPSSVIHFFQAQSWEKLSDYETAALFMEAAKKDDPRISALIKNGLLIGLSSQPPDMEQFIQVA